ncbi:MAG: penicillin-binding protein [Actinomycetota bacterium]|jgi:penicillin-binding protein 1A
MGVLLAFTAVAGVAFLLVNVRLPAEPLLGQTSFLLDAKGQRLATLNNGADREVVSLDHVPDVVVDAVLASEDQHFFEHSGLDPMGIARATWNDLRGHGGLQGGSTITQQYVKNTYLTHERTVWRKLKEAALAIKVERKFDKKQILERYLNTIYFGRGAYGVQAASHAYFGKDIDQVDLREAAYMAGLIRAPELADASTAPSVADGRRAKVLANMVTTKTITSSQARRAEAQPVAAYVSPRADRDATVTTSNHGTDYFVDYVRRQLIATLGEQTAFSGGLRVTTTLDPRTQSQAYSAVYGSTLTRQSDPAGALVSIDDGGQIRAMVGGRNWNLDPESCARVNCKVNLAVGREGGGSGRQPGSTFKSVLLAETVKEGYSVESSFPGPAKITIPKASNGADWNVANFDDAQYGRVNLIDATRNSVNTVYAQLAVAIGATHMRDMAAELGVKAPLKPVNSLVLGTGEVSVMDMASAFSTFANRGVRIEPRAILRIETADGTVVKDFTKPDRKRVLTQEQADVVNFCLRQVVERGSGAGAQVAGKSIIGKTGTTQAFGDAWFVGATTKLTTAVWMGYPEGNSKKMDDFRGKPVTGGSYPATIFKRFMTAATSGVKSDVFPTPSSFPGRILNARVPYVTPTTLPSSSTTAHPGAVSSSTTVRSSPATTAPSGAVPPAPTTTAPPAATTTTAPPPDTTRPRRPPPTTPAG